MTNKKVEMTEEEFHRCMRDGYCEMELEDLNELAAKATTPEEKNRLLHDLWQSNFGPKRNRPPTVIFHEVAWTGLEALIEAITSGKIKTLCDFNDYQDRVAKAA